MADRVDLLRALNFTSTFEDNGVVVLWVKWTSSSWAIFWFTCFCARPSNFDTPISVESWKALVCGWALGLRCSTSVPLGRILPVATSCLSCSARPSIFNKAGCSIELLDDKDWNGLKVSISRSTICSIGMEHTCPLFGFPQREHLYAFLNGSDGFALTP